MPRSKRAFLSCQQTLFRSHVICTTYVATETSNVFRTHSRCGIPLASWARVECMGPSALEAASEQLGAGPYSPRGKPGRRRPAWPRTEDTRSPNSPFCWRRDACPELALRQTWCSPGQRWPAAWMTLMARARKPPERTPLRPVAPVWIGSACALQTVQHATTRCRGQPC